MKIENKTLNILLIIFILVVAGSLRFFHILQIPFTHDEFSAIFRTHFASFGELIEKGIKIDGHPAGIQVFLYYYTQMFGYAEWLVKLPFLIAGVLSVYLVYLLGKKWFGQTTGLICAVMMATLQYPVMYSQVARPYISGLFFTLLMVFFWHKVVFESTRKFFLNLSLYILFSALCAYNHYFSLLFAIIVGVTGLVFIQRAKLVWYIFSGIAIFLLFLPYFNVFLYQLSLKGVGGWLGKPLNDFLFQYLVYVFHFSWFVIVSAVLVVFPGIWKKEGFKDYLFHNRFFLISICWFLIPFLIGFIYSKFVDAVLQASSLIFSFPFLLFMLFGHLGELSAKKNLLLVCCILLVNTLSLVFERDHYTLFYSSPYQGIVEQTDETREKLGDKNVTSLMDSHKKISAYYSDGIWLDTSVTWYNSFKNRKEFINFLNMQKTDYLTYGCISGEDRVAPFIIADYFPYIVQKNDYFNGNFYVFSKLQPDSKKLFKGYENLFGFESHSAKWDLKNVKNITDSLSHSGKHSYKIHYSLEFGPVYEEKLKTIIKNRNDYIDIACWCWSKDKLDDVKLVVTLKAGEKMLEWMATDLEPFRTDMNGNWFKVYFSIKLADIRLTQRNIILNTYIWNLGKKTLYIDDYMVRQRDGNPVIYGLFRKL